MLLLKSRTIGWTCCDEPLEGRTCQEDNEIKIIWMKEMTWKRLSAQEIERSVI